MIKHKEIYKLDSKGKLRVFFIEQDGAKYRMVTGIKDGNLVRSKWTEAKPKNVGKTNATTAEEQATTEIESRYRKKLEQDYRETEETAKDGASFFKPMLAYDWNKAKDKYKEFPLIADPKLDGMRMTVSTDLKPISRKGKEITVADHIASELEWFFDHYPSITLDGELYNHDLKDDFNTLMSIARKQKPDAEDLKTAHEKLQFHIYDIYDQNNPEMPANERKMWLMDHLPILPSIKLVPFHVVENQADLQTIIDVHLKEGYEGTITRGYDSPYVNKRTQHLLKIKEFITDEFPIIDILPGEGNMKDIAGRIIVDVDGKEVGCGLLGNWEYRKKLLNSKEDYIGEDATVRFFEKTEDGSLRFPIVIDINRPD